MSARRSILRRRRDPPRYVPLWVKSNYSFLRGASHPAELVEHAARAGLPAIAVTDRDSVSGVVQARDAVREHGGRLIVGAQMTVDAGRGSEASVVLLAQDREGYARLCTLITTGRMRSPKGQSVVTVDEACAHSDGIIALWAGGRADAAQDVAQDAAQDPGKEKRAERDVVGRLRDAFADRLFLIDARHARPEDPARRRVVEALARDLTVPIVAATEVLYHAPDRRELHDVLTCIELGMTLDEAGSRLRPNATHALASAAEMADRYRDTPDRVLRTIDIAERCSFSIDQIEYRYPDERVPTGYTTAEWLWELTMSGARQRYGGTIPSDVRSQLQKELSVIDELRYCGYFLTMWEIVEYCRRQGILAQGRGSAANSAVCYCLGITAVDPVRMDLLFERFLSRERAEPPDIDLDIEHRRREEVIQHVYEKYGRDRAAMVANVVRYRIRSAIRDVGTVLGLPATTLDRLAKLVSSRDDDLEEVLSGAGIGEHSRALFSRLLMEILDTPRHLSIHPGGFLLGSEPIARLVPVENATMPDRTVIQWDKYDVESMNLFKIDLLGLGALTHLDYCFRLLKRHRGIDLSMATIPHEDPAVFRLIRTGDTVGVFQLESRAQMAMLPRLRPKVWYDIVIEVSIVRPGPITGGMVHPYLRRRAGEEAVVYAHPDLEPVLRKTLGIPIFQEQVMKLAVVAADYTPGEADQLRRDMAAWRSSGRIDAHRERFMSRMLAKGISHDFAEAVFNQIRGFGEYGFPESHAASFALIAYCTAWMRAHYPAEFTCALLNAWPMGFYSPASIVEDARRRGVEMRPVDAVESDWDCTLEAPGRDQPPDRFAVRMGLRYVSGMSERDFRRIVLARGRLGSGAHHEQGSHAARLADFIRLCPLGEELLVNLARAGAFGCFGLSRREALWEVSGASADAPADEHELVPAEEALPEFDDLHDFETVGWDYATANHSVHAHPLEPHRQELSASGFPSAREIRNADDGERVAYVGLVITRQRPATAGGVTFVTLEDETGYVNLVVWKKVFAANKPILLTAALLGVEGQIQSKDGVVHVIVDRCFRPDLSLRGYRTESRNFR
ncbi:MAG: DNA polymerase III subunit alpha [Spirochaetaceae bacterium]|nr:MAG: DNA polymerase III subunit alpha [Spirochaetaceae bacterium]